MKSAKILVIDDDDMVRLSLKMLLEQHFTSVTASAHPQQVFELLENEDYNVILLDMNFKPGATSGEEGLYWLRQIKNAAPALSILLMTAYAEVETAVEGLQQGALDFIVKPWLNEKLIATVQSSLDLNQEKRKVAFLEEQQQLINPSNLPEELLTYSPQMKEVYKIASKIAATDATILITGENGTGKEVLARQIHNMSDRAGKIFMSVDLGSLNENVFESELFGHLKGAFTDAKENRIGRIAAASGGTLFLDEIGNLTLSMQSKILTVLQRREIYPVGSNSPIDVDIRVICATNSNLQQMVKNGEFREDLLYRINTVSIPLPSLKERREDIGYLSGHFYKKFSNKYKKAFSSIEKSAIDLLNKYQWPGNVRELEHAIERAVIMAEDNYLSDKDFKFLSNEFSPSDIFDHLNLENLEAWAIRQSIKKHNGNISHAAEELGLSRGALYRRIEKYNI